MQPSFQEVESFEVETNQNPKIQSSVSSLVERGQNQSSAVLVYSLEATDLSQKPGTLHSVCAVEVTDLNQRLSGSHLQNGILPAFSVQERGLSHIHF